jgi:hypothetical protein
LIGLAERDYRNEFEKPKAFISYDSSDKDVAQQIALTLSKLVIPVWYDDYALVVGSNMRDSIERGLKDCKKCILLLSPRFLENRRWAKREFDSIFTRELLFDEQVLVPIWYGVNARQIYEYSPSLANIVGADLASGMDEVIAKLGRALRD